MAKSIAQNKGSAWLHSPSARKALIAHTWASSPEAGRLNFFAPDFALQNTEPWLVGEADESTVASAPPARSLPPLVHRADPSSAEFARLHEEILMRIHTGEFEKVVPMVSEDFEFAEPVSKEMFRVEARENQWAYGFELAGEGMLGQTPELLFEVDDGHLRTMALAGTAPAHGGSLLTDAKEMHEHRLVIDHILKELAEWGEPRAGVTTERRYGPLKHLYTPIEMPLSRSVEFTELVAKLHPTAALGGWPRPNAVAWLEKQNFHVTRARFGAPFGFVEGERMVCVVAIRGVQWWQQRLKVAAGCGVVAESQVLREWQELELKRRTIFAHLGIDLGADVIP